MERMHDPAHPGEILREELEARGATITAAARALGVTRKALSDVVNLKAGVSPVMARRLEVALGTPARLRRPRHMGRCSLDSRAHE